ncbi:MAG: hypothetical protein LUO80_06640 [Methylococcaceae bacterium]|nr:hypothetical protein [Methylococcaceae bacterium]
MSPVTRPAKLTVRFGLAVLLGTLPVASQAGTVYRCLQNGTVTFTQNAADPTCQPLDVKPYEPDPEVAARKRNELNQWRDDRSQSMAEGRQKKSRQRNRTTDVETPGQADPGTVTPMLPLDLNQVPRTDP